MMRAKVFCSLIALSVFFVFAASVTNAEEAKGKIIDITEAESSGIYKPHTSNNHSIEDLIKIATNFFRDQADKYARWSSLASFYYDVEGLEALRRSLKEDDRASIEMNKQLKAILLIQSADLKTKESYKDLLAKMKKSREQARTLLDRIDKREKVLYATRNAILLHVAQFAEKTGHPNHALQIYSKISLMNRGDTQALLSIQRIVENNKDYYFFFNDELIRLDKPMMKRNGKTYLPIDALSKMNGFEYVENNNTESRMITFESDVLVITEQAVMLNGKYIGSPFLLLKTDNQQYVDLNILFELFNLEIKDFDAVSLMYVVKPTFSYTELDRLTVEEIIRTIFG